MTVKHAIYYDFSWSFSSYVLWSKPAVFKVLTHLWSEQKVYNLAFYDTSHNARSWKLLYFCIFYVSAILYLTWKRSDQETSAFLKLDHFGWVCLFHKHEISLCVCALTCGLINYVTQKTPHVSCRGTENMTFILLRSWHPSLASYTARCTWK